MSTCWATRTSDDCTYFRIGFKARYAGDRSVVVFSDCGIYWDIPGLRHHSPDLAVIFGVKRRKDWETFRVREEGVRPSLIIEITSPKTRVNDVKTKVTQYAQARVPHYVIVDVEKVDGRRRLKLIVYRLQGQSYERVDLDDQGRAWLEPVGLWLGVKVNPETGGDRVVLDRPGDGPGNRRLHGDRPGPAARRGRGPRRAEARTRELEAELAAAAAAAMGADPAIQPAPPCAVHPPGPSAHGKSHWWTSCAIISACVMCG